MIQSAERINETQLKYPIDTLDVTCIKYSKTKQIPNFQWKFFLGKVTNLFSTLVFHIYTHATYYMEPIFHELQLQQAAP